jgi:uncharacterized repeat protein (TIGR01451 family)
MRHQRQSSIALLALSLGLLDNTAVAQASQISYGYEAPGNLVSATVTSSVPPTIFAPATATTLWASNQLSLNVFATGTGLTYQWRLNGTNIAGATNATFFRSAAAGSDGGNYSVVVGDGSTSVTNGAGSVTVLATRNSLWGVAYGLSRYVAVGRTGTIVGSSDLLAWSPLVSNTTNDLFGVAFGNNRFIAVGDNRAIITSTNGVDWTTPTTNIYHLRGVAYGNGTFVAVGTQGTIYTTTDGATATRWTSDTPTLNGVIYGGSQFVVVGTGGTIWTSSDGTNWVGRVSGTSNDLNSVTYGNSTFVAVGTNGTILTSADAVTWITRYSSTTGDFRAITFYNNTFVAVGAYRANYVSASGDTWGVIDSGTDEALFGSAVANSVPLSVGASGSIFRIPFPLADHFDFSLVASPQRENQGFSVTVYAKDAANHVLSDFNSTATLSATMNQPATNTILGNVTIPTNSYGEGSYTIGYAFSPNVDITVTHVRYTSGKQVSIWTGDGALLASVPVPDSGRLTNWTEKALPLPLNLSAGEVYVVSFFTTNSYWYPTNAGLSTFAHGAIDTTLFTSNAFETFPILLDSAKWFFVDLRYTVDQESSSLAIAPLVTGNFVDGVWTGTITVQDSAVDAVLQVTDAAGHTGFSNPFNVYPTNDLAVTVSDSPDPGAVGSSLTYTVTVMNSGASTSTGVMVTNTLPAGVTYVSATPSQGMCTHAGGIVTCTLGSVGGAEYATVDITVIPNSAGTILTNIAKVGRTEVESNYANNQATITTVVPPDLSISNVSVTEGNIVRTNAVFLVTLSPASALTVTAEYSTFSGSATSGVDYFPTNGMLTFLPGATSQTVSVTVQGDLLIESNETFFVNLANPANASTSTSQGTGTILNDDGIAGQIDHLVWSSISSPQRTNQSFTASITAKDVSESTATGFNGTVALLGTKNVTPTTNSSTILGGPSSSLYYNNQGYTFGYSFTPSTNIAVTHLRYYSGTRVSIWTDAGQLLVYRDIESTPGVWVETPLDPPIVLTNGNRYRLSFYSTGIAYTRTTLPTTFLNGAIHQSYYSPGNAFPIYALADKWLLVDLRYSVASSFSPASVALVNGTWTGNITMLEEGAAVILRADDNNGHSGVSNPFDVMRTNDLEVNLSAYPTPITVGSNLSYSVMVLNSGPGASTSVLVTNTFSPDVSFVSATPTQGSCSYSNGILNCNLGTIGGLASATVTIVVTPIVANKPFTNAVTVARSEAEADVGNNTASIVNSASVDYGLLIAEALDAGELWWSLGGDKMWGNTNSYTHDGTDSAQTGPIGHNQETWIETSVYGPGTLTFWWLISSQAGYDILRFDIDGQQTNSISGTTGNWTKITNSVGPGWHTLRWTYSKDGSVNGGLDTAWLDQVSFTIPPFNLGSWLMQTNGQFEFRVNGTDGQRLAVEATEDFGEWLSLTTNTVSGGYFNYTDSESTNHSYRFYRAVHSPE